MNSNLEQLVNHLVFNYREPLSMARLIYMIYLSDWKSALESSSKISGIHWNGLIELSQEDYDKIRNLYEKALSIKDLPVVDVKIKLIADHVLHEVGYLPWDEFERVVNSTYPLFRYSDSHELNILALANEYKKKKILAH